MTANEAEQGMIDDGGKGHLHLSGAELEVELDERAEAKPKEEPVAKEVIRDWAMI